MNFKTTFILLITFLNLTSSCKKEEKIHQITNQNLLYAKWDINNINSYRSFEFNKSGNYLVTEVSSKKTKKTDTVHFGTYKYLSSEIIKLSGYGTITLSNLQKETISFKLKPLTGLDPEIILNGNKHSEYAATTNTNLLCRSWKLTSLNGKDVRNTEDEFTVLYSKAGTYYVDYTYSDAYDRLAAWNWKNDEETTVCYNPIGTQTCTNDNQISITELTDQHLKIFQEFVDDPESLTYILEPVNQEELQGQGRAIINTPPQTRDGFFH